MIKKFSSLPSFETKKTKTKTLSAPNLVQSNVRSDSPVPITATEYLIAAEKLDNILNYGRKQFTGVQRVASNRVIQLVYGTLQCK